jgi:hypothetical protein
VLWVSFVCLYCYETPHAWYVLSLSMSKSGSAFRAIVCESVCVRMAGSFLFVPECGALYLGSLQTTARSVADLFMWERYAIRHNIKTLDNRRHSVLTRFTA